MAVSRSTELKVGIFVVGCLVVMAGLIIRFGQYRPGRPPGYEIQVLFPNAAGLIPDAKVMYAGIPIGRVAGIELTGRKDYPVRVRLVIRAGEKIPTDAGFLINQSGLLGDRFVDVTPGGGPELLAPGSTATGLASVDLSEAIGKVKAALDQAGETIAKLDVALQHLNESVLSTQSLAHARNFLVNVDAVSSNAVALAHDLQMVVAENRTQLTRALDEFHGTAVDLRAAARRADDLVQRGTTVVTNNEADVRAVIKNLSEASARLDALLASAQQGSGTVGRLWVDPSLYTEVLQLVQHWRQHGILARDRRPAPARPDAAPPPATNFQPRR